MTLPKAPHLDPDIASVRPDAETASRFAWPLAGLLEYEITCDEDVWELADRLIVIVGATRGDPIDVGTSKARGKAGARVILALLRGLRGSVMVELRLHYVDELLGVRHDHHGDKVGAPPLVLPGIRRGASINRACIVLLSATLQGFIEEVSVECGGQAQQMGNPNEYNITKLYRKLGKNDILAGLRWQKCANQKVRDRLSNLVHIRNSIAHGDPQLTVLGADYSLTLPKAIAFRNFAVSFRERFENHVRGRLGLPPLACSTRTALQTV